MARKSEAEIELVRESARWCEHAHRLLQEYTRPGVTEAQAGLRAGYEASLAMLDALGPSYDGGLSSTDGASAGYRGQIGERSAWAHAVAHNIEFRPGDVLVSETAAPVWGYNAELERAMIVGPPTDEMRRHFDHMRAAQQVAFAALRPGVTCADVDRAVLAYFEEQGILDTWSQHTGHAIGLRNHEAPFLDVGDETVGRAGNGVHDRAGRLRGRPRRVPPLGHGRRPGRRDRDPHGLPERHRVAHAAGLTATGYAVAAMDAWRAHVLRQNG